MSVEFSSTLRKLKPIYDEYYSKKTFSLFFHTISNKFYFYVSLSFDDKCEISYIIIFL